MKLNVKLYTSVILAACAAACGDSGANMPPVTTTPGATPAAPITPAPTAPSATGTAGSAPITRPPVATPTAPVTPPPAAMNPTAPVNPTTPPVTTPPANTPMMGEMGTGAARFPDACSERRASWGKPCNSNPDPCNLKSGYPGDEYCLLPPPEGKGIQVHFGPKNYKDPAEIKEYLINAGEEFNQSALVNVPNTGDGKAPRYFQYMKVSMRPGSHHLINNLVMGHGTEGFGACTGSSLGSFPGTQNLITENPPQGIPAPENAKLGRTLPNNVSICQNYHRYNITDKPQISEIWYNIWFVDESQISEKTSPVTVNGLITSIPPGTKQSVTATATASADGRFVQLFGHRHSHTVRFATWLNDMLIYDSWDWVESRVFNYDSITMNPAPNPAAKTDGAVSGIVNFKKGDKVKIQCDINNDSNVTLRFANELNTGEMCILFGASVGGTIGGGFGGQ